MCACVYVGCAQMHEDVWDIHQEMYPVYSQEVVLKVLSSTAVFDCLNEFIYVDHTH